MAHKQYPDIAAARHLREQPLETGQGPDRRRGIEASSVAGKTMSRKDPGYRRKRLVAATLTTVVALSVPTLITLLVLFG